MSAPNDNRDHDPVNHPRHYTGHPSGIEAIQICEHMNFCRGNAMKYLWRAGEKGDEIEDLKKARWYLDREIDRLQMVAAAEPNTSVVDRPHPPRHLRPEGPLVTPEDLVRWAEEDAMREMRS